MNTEREIVGDKRVPGAPITFAPSSGTAWVENLSAVARRRPVAEAGRRLNDWVHGDPEWRPSRGEVKAWVTLTEDDRRELHNRVEALTKENEALTAQRDNALGEERTARDASTIYYEDAEALRRERNPLQTLADSRRRKLDALEEKLAAVRAQRDEALEGYREDVERFRAHVETLAADRTRRTKERDEALDALSLVRETVARQLGRYEELRGAYNQAEGERNELARRVGVGRASCSHTSQGGAE